MLRLPAALRGLLASSIFRNHGPVVPGTQRSLSFGSGFLRPSRRSRDALPSSQTRCNATASAGPEESPSLAIFHDLVTPERQKAASAVFDDLQANHNDIGDEVYDQMERELLLKCLQQPSIRPTRRGFQHMSGLTRHALTNKDSINVLRFAAIADGGMPELLRAKAQARLEKGANGMPTNEWLQNIPGVVDSPQMGSQDDVHKAEAIALLDDLWLASLSTNKPSRRAQIEISVREYLAGTAPLDSLKATVAGLPESFQTKMRAVPSGLVHSQSSPALNTDEEPQARTPAVGVNSTGIATVMSDDKTASPASFGHASAEQALADGSKPVSKPAGEASRPSVATPGSSRDPADEPTSVSTAASIGDAAIKAKVEKLRETIQSSDLSRGELDEAKMLLAVLRGVRKDFGSRSGRGDPRVLEVLERAIASACNSAKPLDALKLIALEYSSLPQASRLRICNLFCASGADDTCCSDTAAILSQLYKYRKSTTAKLVAELELFDSYQILETCPMPTKKRLPLARPSLWNPKQAQQFLRTTCRNRKPPMEIEEKFLEQPIPDNKRGVNGVQRYLKRGVNGVQRYLTCQLKVKIAGVCEETSHGDGIGRTDAQRAAWIHLVSKLHLSGALVKLFGAPVAVRSKKAAMAPQDRALQSKGDSTPPQLDPTSLREPQRLFDLERIVSTSALPTKEQYTHVPDSLWDPKFASTMIHNGCAKVKLSLESELSYTEHQIPSELLHHRPSGMATTLYTRCTLQVVIGNLCQEAALGEGFSKTDARRAAWVHALSRLHVSGALAEIFPEPTGKKKTATQARSKGQGAGDAVEHRTAGENSVRTDVAVQDIVEEEQMELAEIDKQTLEEEKDAKIEIYNYTAGFGLVPQFETRFVQPRTPRARLGRRPKMPAPVMQVTIKVEELSIDVTATGTSIQTAEVAAALAFKKGAEERHLKADGSNLEDRFQSLSTETARQFLDFCTENGVSLNLGMEIEVQESKITGHQAVLTSNGNQLGQTSYARTKKDARAIAYLTGALDVAKRHMQLLEQFGRALKRGHGKVLKAVDTIALDLEPEASQTMREALVEAHAAGLPTAQEALSAATPDAEIDTTRRRQVLNEDNILTARQTLLQDQKAFDANPALQEMREKKASLPMSQYRSQLLDMINGNSYSIVVGATGSGKTTQVPQILFEDAVSRSEGPHCNVICTQPRRIAATSVAQRVADERNEPLRKTVGHHVRFDARLPYNPYGVTYCTTGILLEKLKHDPDGVLGATSHILIDEVHERDSNIDFLMIVLKKAVKSRRIEGKKVPKVVLMSATLDTQLFANYFQQPGEDGKLRPAPCLSVPGRTFPVKEKYLGSIMHELISQHGSDARQLIGTDPQSEQLLEAETKFSSSKSGETGSSDTKRDAVIDWKREHTSVPGSDEVLDAKNEKEESLVPVGLLAATIAHICATTPEDGAILAFVPGLDEITKTQDMLLKRRICGQNFADASKFKICLLHSAVPKDQQSEVFETCPPGCRKIILSTNIAETSVTVTDVKYVVDTGKLRENRYDQLRRITKLQCVWESKSNSRQRMGRAGRVQDGFYYALFSKERADSLRAVGLPELLRTDLQETSLSITSQKFNEPVASFLAQAIEPPSNRAVEATVKDLTAIGAYTADEELTALGRVLSRLPIHPALGKMIIFGVIFKCLDPMIALGAAAEERPLFTRPPGAVAEAKRAHASYAGTAQSDQLAQLAAFKELRRIRHHSGTPAAYARARQQFLHFGGFRNIEQSAHQILQVLTDSGLIPRSHTNSSGPAYGPADLNTNADNSDLIKCLLLAGSHPNLAVKSSDKGSMFRTPTENVVLMHPSSVNNARAKAKGDVVALPHPQNTLFTYSTLSASGDGARFFLRESTKVTPLMAVLFGGQLRFVEGGRKLEMDGWIPFTVRGEAREREYQMKLVLEFKKALERVLQGAYASLANLGRRGGDGMVRGFGDDPVREMFAKRVVEVLGDGAGVERTAPWRAFVRN